MPTNETLVLDATVLIDYFGEKTDIDTATLRENFDNVVFSDNNVTILANTVVMIEFVAFLYYILHQSVKELKDTLRRAKNHSHLVVYDYGQKELFDSINQIHDLPQNLKCHAGELSLLSLIHFDEIFVSSDSPALTAYKIMNRKDLRRSTETIPKGVDFQP